MTKTFDKETLTKMLLNKDYSFAEDPFEPSSNKPIDKDNLSGEALAHYLKETYQIKSDRLHDHKLKIEEIIGKDRAEYLIKLNKSEYLKMLAHFSILSKVKKGWDNLLITNLKGKSKPSLSNNPIAAGTLDSKKVNDAVILCFYSRLLEGMTEEDKERYQILFPIGPYTTGLDGLLVILDKSIQDLFSFEKQKLDGYDVDGCDESLLPDSHLGEAIERTYNHLNHVNHILNLTEKAYRADTLRATLVKCATLNRALNDIDAIFNIQNKIIHNLPDDLGPLLHIKSESEILPAISSIFNEKITNLPNDLIKCSKLVCKMYIDNSSPPEEKTEFNERHMMPDCIAVSAALLYHDFLQKTPISLNIRGENNNTIPNVYNALSDFAEKGNTPDILTNEILTEHGVQEELFKYLTTRYSISVHGLSDCYPSKIGAEAHFKVKKEKLQLQKNAYELLKDISVKDVSQWIFVFHHYVEGLIKPSTTSS